MTQSNAYKSSKYFLTLFLLIIAGCAEQPINHSVFNESPPSHFQEPYPSKTYNIARAKSIKSIFFSHKTIWDRLFSLYALPEINNERIDKEIQRYLRHPDYLSKIQKRAAPYLYFILDEIEAKNLPGEFALLPVVESGFNPNAISKSKASGLWQFMPATGRLFGLKQNSWYDGRNDIYTSTQAATTYLKQLSNLYNNDWFLALASYNAGKGNIRKAIRKNLYNKLPTDYWSLPLREETKAYVPRLLAIAKIFANSEKYNIALQDIPNKPHFSVVDIESQLDLKIASELAGIHINEFISLNPAFKRGTTGPKGSFRLLINTDKASIFKRKLSRTAKKNRIRRYTLNSHKVVSGENLSIIAKNYQTTIHALRKANLLTTNNLSVGQRLRIPTSINKTSKAKKQLYIVKKGDTFWDIAKQFSVRSKDIAHWNNLSLSKALFPGQKLIIKKG